MKVISKTYGRLNCLTTILLVLIVASFILVPRYATWNIVHENLMMKAEDVEYDTIQNQIHSTESNQSTNILHEIPLLAGNLERIAERSNDRVKRIRDHCNYLKKTNQTERLHRLTIPSLLEGHYFTSQKYKLIFRRTPKCGSSTWVAHFKDIEGEAFGHHTTTYEKLLSKWNHLINDGYMAFVFARHPLKRLVSAYKNKLEVFRPRSRQLEGAAKNIVAEYDNETTRTHPTFFEFVTSIIDEKFVDHHWKPLSNHVGVCSLVFSFIGKIETFDEDTNYILELRNIRNITKLSVQKNKNPPYSDQDYYSKITKQQLMKLYDIYRDDFELFGYNMDEYINYVHA